MNAAILQDTLEQRQRDRLVNMQSNMYYLFETNGRRYVPISSGFTTQKEAFAYAVRQHHVIGNGSQATLAGGFKIEKP